MQKSLYSDHEISHDRIFLVPQKVGVNLVEQSFARLADVFARINRADAHLLHQTADPLAIHVQPVLADEHFAHHPAAVVQVVGEDLVDAVHQLDRRLGLRPGHVVVARATDFQELALSAY